MKLKIKTLRNMLQYKFLLNIYFCVYIGEKQEEAANLGYLILLIFIF